MLPKSPTSDVLSMYHSVNSIPSSTMRGDQLFVSVIYDFEYISEEGKRVFMKENEILLLINKTNQDWWQVIRRGDRRPFYAPAKYVSELRPQEVEAAHQRREMKSRGGGRANVPWHFNANKTRPVFSTFTGGGISKPQSGLTSKEPSPPPTSYGGNKRHSYASPGGRFHERYRSNSLDSILVADLDSRPQGPPQPVRHSYHVSTGPPAYHIYPAEHHLIPKSQVTLIRGRLGLSKRPTIEGLDKRKSWSLDISSRAISSRDSTSLNSVVVESGPASVISSKAGSRISSYQNTDGLLAFGGGRENRERSDPKNQRKKPVPLPRSKLPEKEKTVIATPPQSQPQPNRLFQRSRTDLGSDALSNYKAKRPIGVAGLKYPAPKVPTFNRPVPQKRNVTSTLSEVPSQSTSNNISSTKGPRPVPKEKPAFTTFKTSKRANSEDLKLKPVTTATVPEARMSRAASEGDILGQLQEETSGEIELESIQVQDVVGVQREIESESVQEICVPSEFDKKLVDRSVSEQTAAAKAENEVRKSKSEPLTITSLPLVDKTSRESVSEWMDKSCSSSFDDSSMMQMSTTGERSTDVSMEEQDLCSLESCVPGDSSQQDRQLMSPCSTTSRSPPSPMLGMSPKRQVTEEWDEYEDGLTGRKFYYNPVSKEKSWKPPRKSKGSSEGYSAPTSPCPDGAGETAIDGPDSFMSTKIQETPLEEEIFVPDGYERKTSVDSGSPYFVNIFTGVRYFSAETDSGKTYYYEENGNESCWVLPNVSYTIQDPNTNIDNATDGSASKASISIDFDEEAETDDAFDEEVTIRPTKRSPKARPATAMPTVNRPASASRPELPRLNLPVSTPNFQIGKVNIIVIKQGPLNKTKLVENGKKHRKNWTVSHIVLTDTFLLFFKDAKTFAAMQSGSLTKPEHCLDLKGATVAWCTGDKSKRSNVFEVSTQFLGITILLQDDDLAIAAEWCREIGDVADRLTHKGSESLDQTLRRKGSNDSNLQPSSTLQMPARKLSNTGSRVNRTKSLKMKFLGGPEELGSVPASPTTGGAPSTLQHQNSNKVNIREKLRKFFMRRPAMDDLFRRGIMKNEPVFGSTLRELQATDLCDVPLFVKKCVAEIEKGDLLKTDGVYRQSGNLSHIQKIRFQVDQGNLAILETVDDVHVLTGALKLFFRELKEPLILWDVVDKLLLACNHQSRKVKLKQMRDCIVSLPQAHRATLAFLLRHLLRVTDFKDTNRMQIPNMAIVFGPTLMWPPSHLVSHNLALSMMQQNIIVEALLNNVETIFA